MTEEVVEKLDRANMNAQSKGEENLSHKEKLEAYFSSLLDDTYEEKPSLIERAKRFVNKGNPPKSMSQTAMEMYNAESVETLPISNAHKEMLLEEFGDDPKEITKHLLKDPEKASIIQGFKGGHNGCNKEAVAVLESMEQIELIEEVRPLDEALAEGPQKEIPSMNSTSSHDKDLDKGMDRDDDSPER
ncbi:MAG TPA: hypothetical protein EYQ86_07955 [Bacteroidetes bacterium]|nr:hypothetical protein [Bacteroidota bacterium]